MDLSFLIFPIHYSPTIDLLPRFFVVHEIYHKFWSWKILQGDSQLHPSFRDFLVAKFLEQIQGFFVNFSSSPLFGDVSKHHLSKDLENDGES